MNTWKLTLIFCVMMSVSFAQVAVVQDADGYSNVRSEGNSKSKVIFKLKTDVAFFYGEGFHDKTKEWIKVFIPKNKYSLDCHSRYLEGYIHRSRIKPIEELKKFQGKNFNFALVTKPFQKNGKIIDFVDEEFVLAINGFAPFGIDGNIPKTEIKEVKIELNGKKINVSEALTMDLYECTDNSKIYKVGNTFFVHLSCSDGAGFYELVWVINDEGIKQRLVGSII